MKITILGCGGSGGVPSAAGGWGACDPANPRNRRRRASILIEMPDPEGVLRRFVVDTGPDFREQCLSVGLAGLDGVFYTHGDADHMHGIDDLRAFNRKMQRVLPVWADARTLAQIQARFGYVLMAPTKPGFFFRPAVIGQDCGSGFEAYGIPVLAFEQDHGFSTTTGYRIGGFAYSTDVVRLSDAALAGLTGLDLWVVDCLQLDPHMTHAHLARTLEWIAAVKPKRAVLTHMDTSLDYATLAERLPEGVEPAYDGMVLAV